MKSISITVNSGDTPVQQVTSVDVNAVMGIKEWVLILILSVIWGGSFFFVGVAVKEMTPLAIVLCRVGFASVILLAVVGLTGKKCPRPPACGGRFSFWGP